MEMSRRSYTTLIDKIKSKLAGWQVNCLSMASRITLASSVLFSMPIYNMLLEKLPKKVCQDIEKIQRNFIRGHDETTRKTHG